MPIQPDKCMITIKRSTRSRIRILAAHAGVTIIEYVDKIIPGIVQSPQVMETNNGAGEGSDGTQE